MKANELFEQIHAGKIKEGTKIKVINDLLENCVTIISYKNGRLNWQPGEFDTSFFCSADIDFVIKENKEIEEKLDWEEIIGSIGKPVWDNKKKKWRVLDYYCREGDIFYVSFSDINNREKFNEKELYFKEREEK